MCHPFAYFGYDGAAFQKLRKSDVDIGATEHELVVISVAVLYLRP
jgi:hypothetical protein